MGHLHSGCISKYTITHEFGECSYWSKMDKFGNCSYRIRTTPQEDNSPSYRFWSWWVVLFRGSGPSGELSWWWIVLQIVVLVGNGWALFLSGGELSSWGVVLESALLLTHEFSFLKRKSVFIFSKNFRSIEKISNPCAYCLSTCINVYLSFRLTLTIIEMVQ